MSRLATTPRSIYLDQRSGEIVRIGLMVGTSTNTIDGWVGDTHYGRTPQCSVKVAIGGVQ